MEILHRQELSLSILKPLGAQAGLALGTVPVAAGVIRDAGFVAASGTDIDMASQSRCPTAGDGADDLELLEAEPVSVSLTETAALGAEVSRLTVQARATFGPAVKNVMRSKTSGSTWRTRPSRLRWVRAHREMLASGSVR